MASPAEPSENRGMAAYAAPVRRLPGRDPPKRLRLDLVAPTSTAAPPSLYQPHNARQALRDAHAGKIPPLLGCYYGISSVPACRFLAPLGFDAVWIDWEHTACNVETMTTMVYDTMFMSQGRTIPFVRLPSHDPVWIAYALGAGASIVAPCVETVSQCRALVAATKFGPPGGTRSAPPMRWIAGVTDTPLFPERGLHGSLNQQAALMIQIETLAGLDNLDAMLRACPAVDCVWLSTLDTRVSMGLPGNHGMGGDEPAWRAVVERFREIVKRHGKPTAGFGLSPDAVRRNAEGGMALIISDMDVARLAAMAQGLQETRKLVAEVKRSA
ncbi:Phosphoenolpyruvate/pyruvate domain-containing protein [Xylariomycetidae sp. FL0641]|nr:Phosphoenolpyruvate/pyruvate domain-containing protein [Xylariomycetidae sp. FL0641]